MGAGAQRATRRASDVRRARSADFVRGPPQPAGARSIQMLDVIMLAIGLGFFALAVGYAYACERL